MTQCTYGRDVFFTDPQTGGTRRGREVTHKNGRSIDCSGEFDASEILIFDPLSTEHFFVRYGDLKPVPAPLKSEAP